MSSHYIVPVSLAVLALIGILVVGNIVVPKSFGMYTENVAFEWYRGDAVAEIAMNKPVYVAPAACGECHEEQFKDWESGAHSNFFCGNCHGPGTGHPDEVRKLPINKSYEACLICHGKVLGRPASFPQIDIKEHFNFDPKTMTCMKCHNPHKP